MNSSYYAIDVGNTFSVLYDGSKTISLKSVISQPRTEFNVRPGSNVVRYNGNIYHVGKDAFKYDMYRVMATQDKQTVSSIDDAVVLTLNLIGKVLSEYEPSVELSIQVPDLVTDYHHQFTKALNGVKVWSVDKVHFETRILVRDVYQEGYGSWMCAHRATILPPNGYSLVIDLGGGTTITSLVDNRTGEVIRSNSIKKAGVVCLANLLRADNDLIRDNDGLPVSVEQVFDALESKTYRIGVNGADFKPYLELYAHTWWKYVWDLSVSTYNTQFSRREINRAIITGGGAEVVRPFIEVAKSKSPVLNELFMISERPLLDNVIGIYYASEK